MELRAYAAARGALAVPDPGAVRLDAITLLGPDRERDADLLALHVQARALLVVAREVAGAGLFVAAEEIGVRLIRAEIDDQVVGVMRDRVVDRRRMDAQGRGVARQDDPGGPASGGRRIRCGRGAVGDIRPGGLLASEDREPVRAAAVKHCGCRVEP